MRISSAQTHVRTNIVSDVTLDGRREQGRLLGDETDLGSHSRFKLSTRFGFTTEALKRIENQ